MAADDPAGAIKPTSGQTLYHEYRASNTQLGLPAWQELSPTLRNLWQTDPGHAEYATWKQLTHQSSAPGWAKLTPTQQQDWQNLHPLLGPPSSPSPIGTAPSGLGGTQLYGGAPFDIPPATMSNPDTSLDTSPGFFASLSADLGSLWQQYSVEIIIGIGVVILAIYGYRHGWPKKIESLW